jgi:aspartate aminotransferase
MGAGGGFELPMPKVMIVARGPYSKYTKRGLPENFGRKKGYFAMFENLTSAPPDPILGLTEAFRHDPNPRKINLGVGVYKTADNKTPILRAVKQAERQLLESEDSKGYLSIAGIEPLGRQVRQLLWGDRIDDDRCGTVQTPGGTGGLRVAADFLADQFPGMRMWCSTPTWANHPKVFAAGGMDVQQYKYLAADGVSLDFDGMLDSLQSIPKGDAICLHGCCHNPTGVDPTEEQWGQIAQIVQERQLLPLLDFAYQGFGTGVEEDALGLRAVVATGVDALVCSSFSKNFGLYGERIGALTAVAADAKVAATTLSNLKISVRTNYSNPPQHGGAIVSAILASDTLTQMWLEELAEMRNRIWEMRSAFVEAMKERCPDRDFSFISKQIGMFSYSGLTPMQVDELRSKYAIYIVGSGRINVAGINQNNLPILCDAIASVL